MFKAISTNTKATEYHNYLLMLQLLLSYRISHVKLQWAIYQVHSAAARNRSEIPDQLSAEVSY